MSQYIPVALRAAVTRRDKEQCVYCRSQEELLGMPFEVDHIVPVADGGETAVHNLCLACPRCNRFKAYRTAIFDTETNKMIDLFHPVQDVWNAHFAWSEDFCTVIALTDVGRVTINALRMNRPRLVNVRRYWVILNMHPPT